MIDTKKLTVSASPHQKSADTTTGIMRDVIIALVPAGIAAVLVFGLRALAVIVVSVVSCVLAEFLSRKAMKKEDTITDLSAVVTGLLLAYNLPSNIPFWIVVLGAVIAIVVIKQMFGGIGQNFINPALGARVILMSAFPGRMSAGAFAGLNKSGWDVDALTGATPMGMVGLDGVKEGAPTLSELFFGNVSGCLGEVSAIALLLGGIYLMVRKVISPIIPCTYIATVAIFCMFAQGFDMYAVAYELLAGGLFLGEEHRALRRAALGELLEHGVRRADAFIDLHVQLFMPQIQPHAAFGQRVARGEQPVALVGRGFDHKTVRAQLLDRLPDSRPAERQLRRQRTARDIVPAAAAQALQYQILCHVVGLLPTSG